MKTHARTTGRRRAARFGTALVLSGCVASAIVLADGPAPATGVKYAQMDVAGMREWLTYLSSDELQGRQIFTEGYGLAASYVADHLREWKLKPLGADGTYFENV